MNSRFSCILFFVLFVLLDGLGAVARGADEGAYVILVDEVKKLENPSLVAPTNLFLDEAAEEIYVGRGRYIYVFNPSAILLIRLDAGDGVTARRLAVDSGGMVYVLDWDQNRVWRYDLFGKRLGEVKLEGLPPGADPGKVSLAGLALDRQDRLYLLDEGNGYGYRADPRGTIQKAFGEGKLRGYSDLDVSPDGELLAFLSFEEGRVRTYRTSGELVAEFGKRTGGSGGFSQPVAVRLAPDKKVFVLDRNRGTLLAFAPEGELLGELGWGGFGLANDLRIDSRYHLLVADALANRLLSIKVSFQERKRRPEASPTPVGQGDKETTGVAGSSESLRGPGPEGLVSPSGVGPEREEVVPGKGKE